MCLVTGAQVPLGVSRALTRSVDGERTVPSGLQVMPKRRWSTSVVASTSSSPSSSRTGASSESGTVLPAASSSPRNRSVPSPASVTSWAVKRPEHPPQDPGMVLAAHGAHDACMAQQPRDLHDGFRDPRRVPAGDLEHFLEQADRLPGIRVVQHALRDALEVRPGARLLDAGCGIGLETARLAAENPETHVTGLDRNRELLRIAQGRAGSGTTNSFTSSRSISNAPWTT